MNVVIMLLESNCLSLSLAQNWSALRRSYHCAMLVLLDAGQGPAMGKMRKEGSWCQQLGLVPSSPAPGLDATLCPGSRKPCPQASGSSPTWTVPMRGLPSAQQSHHPCGRELSVRMVPSTMAIWGPPAQSLSCVQGKEEAPGSTCMALGRDAGRALLCCSPASHQWALPASHARPCTSALQGL